MCSYCGHEFGASGRRPDEGRVKGSGRMPCRHLAKPDEAYTIERRGETPAPGPDLCEWAQNVAPNQLLGVPRWLSRAALAGHLIAPGDCGGCPCYDEGRAVAPR